MLIPTRKAITENTMTQEDLQTGSLTTYRSTGAAVSGFIKPDKITRNVKDEHGFRKPSPYACPSYGKLFVIGEVMGSEVVKTFRGDAFDIRKQGDVIVDLSPPVIPVRRPDALRMRILSNIKDEVFDVAMVLAEMQKTTDMLSGALYTLGRSLRAVKDRKPQHFSYLMHGRRNDNRRPTDKFLRESAGIYLQWKYGITPTLLDIQGATRALDMNVDGSFFDNPPNMVARARIVDKTPIDLQGRGKLAASGDFRLNVPAVLKREQKARCDYIVTGEGLRGLSRYGLGLGTVATVLWDRQPFSFVLDMAFPVADMIKAWTALGGVDVKGYSETFHDSIVQTNGVSRILKNLYIPQTVITVENQGVLRTSWKRDAFPRPPFPVPFIRNPIKTSNLSTVLALFTQLRKP